MSWFEIKLFIYLINAFVQLKDCSERDSRVVLFAKHCMRFAGSGGAVYKYRAVEAIENDVDEILGRCWKTIQKNLIRSGSFYFAH